MKARFAIFAAAIFTVTLAACGGGGSGGTGRGMDMPPVQSTPAASETVTFSAAPATISVPSGVGTSGTITVPSGSGSAVITAVTTLPSSVQSLGGVLAYLSVTAQGGSVTMNGLPGITLTLSSKAATGSYYLGYFATAGQQPAWVSSLQQGVAGSANATITIPAAVLPTITLASGEALYLAIYRGNYIPPINIFGCVGGNTVANPATANRLNGAFIGVHPITPNDAYNYSGTFAQTITRTQPCPQPAATANATVTVAVTMSPDPSANVSHEDSVETDTFATNQTQVTTDAIVATPAPANPQRYVESSETSTDLVGNRVVTVYAAPGLQFAQTPESAATSWSNSQPQSVAQTLADGTTLNRTYGGAGIFYKETDVIPGGFGQNVITANSDGSGTYAIAQGTTGEVDASVSAPSNGSITYTVTVGTQVNTLTVPAWFTPGQPFYSDQTQDAGPVSSLSCAFTPTSGTFEKLVRTINLIDPVLGYTETQTITTDDVQNYNGTGKTIGPVCASISDTLTEYYDYSLDTISFLSYVSLNGQPVLTNMIAESLTLNVSPLTANVVRRDASALSLRSELHAHLASIHFTRALERARRVESITRMLRSRLLRGGMK